MKIIQKASTINVEISKSEWIRIGNDSGWLKKEADNMDLTRQMADTKGLFDAMDKMRADIGALQNNNDPNVAKATQDSILAVLNDLKQNNWVAKLDAEIGLALDALEGALLKNDQIGFNQLLEKKLKAELNESKAQLDRQLAQQQGAATGVQVNVEEGSMI